MDKKAQGSIIEQAGNIGSASLTLFPYSFNTQVCSTKGLDINPLFSHFLSEIFNLLSCSPLHRITRDSLSKCLIRIAPPPSFLHSSQSWFSQAGLGQPTGREVQTVLQPRVTHATTICTDGTKAYRRLCREAKLPLVAVNGGKRLQGSIYHVNSINAYHSRLKGWMVRFKGMATPYLQHYLYWHLFTDQATKTSPLTATRQFLVEVCCTTEAGSIAKIRRAS